MKDLKKPIQVPSVPRYPQNKLWEKKYNVNSFQNNCQQFVSVT